MTDEAARISELENLLAKQTALLNHREEELAVIKSVQEALVKEMDMESIYELVGEKIREIFNAQVIDIVNYDAKNNLIEDKYSYEKGDRTLLGPRAPNGFRKYVIEHRQMLLHNEHVEQAIREFDNAVLIGEMPKSQVYVPMIAGGEVKGIISLQNLDHEHAFSNSDVNLITTLANSMSVALESARLFDETNRLLKETEQRNAELAVINRVQESLVAKRDMAGIYELVGEKIREIFDAQVIDIVAYDKRANLIKDVYAYEKGDRTLLGARPPNGFRKHVIQSRQLLLHNENVERALREFGNEILIGETPKSQVYVPMIAGGEVKGIISLQNLDHEHAFTESHVSLLTTLANSMSVALESARLFDETARLLKETEQRTAELSVINSVQEGLAKELSIEGIYDMVGEKMREIFNAQVIDIVTYDKTTDLITDRYTYEKGDRSLLAPRPLKGFRKHVVETGRPLVINRDVDQQRSKFDQTVIVGKGARSIVLVPMIAGGEVTGVISLQNLDQENAFPDSDVNLLTMLTNSMSVALENARLFDETTRLLKETEQRTAELAVINSVQEGLAKELDMQAIYDLVGNKIRDVFSAQVVIIADLNQDAKTEHFKYLIEKGERFYLEPRPYDKLRQHLIDTQEKILISSNFTRAAEEFGMTVLPGTELPKSLLFVPLISGEKVKSYVSLQNIDYEHAFNESDVRLLETLANSMSVALENARLFDETTRLLKETEQRTAELAVINSVQEGLAKELHIDAIYNLVGEKLSEVMNTLDIDIRIFSPVTNQTIYPFMIDHGVRMQIPPQPLGGISRHVYETGKTLLINEKLAERMAELGSKLIPGTQMEKSYLAVPIMAGTEVMGMVSISNYLEENAFTDAEVRLLQTVVSAMSVALKNAKLFDETSRLLKETEERNAELAVITSVQQGLASKLEFQSIIDLIGDKVTEIFNAQATLISLYDHSTREINHRYLKERGQRLFVNKPVKIDRFRQRVVETRQPWLINQNYRQIAMKLGEETVLEGEEPKSLLFVPMIVGDEVTGTISLQNLDIEDAFSPADVRLLQTIANSMSVALENARLFDETQRLLKETEQRTAELSVINSVQQGLAKELDMQGIYDLIGDRLCDLFPDTQTLVIRTFDHASGLEHWKYAKEKGERLYSEPRPFIWANKQLIATKQPLLINENYVETSKKYGGTGVSKGKPPQSATFVPMIVGDVVRGSVSLQNVDKENAFTESHLRLLMTLTNSMSVALENARLFDETSRLLAEAKQRASELSTVNSISRALASQLDPDELIQIVGDQLKELFNANIVYLALLNKKTNMIHFPYQYGDDNIPMKLGEGLTSRIILSKEPLLINKDVQEIRARLGVQTMGIPAASYLGVPIPVGDEIIGVLSVQSTEEENKFNENDLRLLTTIASSVGVALSNARLFEEAQKSKMEAEAASKAAEKANEAKSAFLSTVSHELRTPLTSVLGFTKIIRKRLDDKIFPAVSHDDPKTARVISQISENLNVVISEGERLTNLINDVLDLAKIEAGKMEWNLESVSINEIAERALAATTSLFEQKHLKLIRHIDPDLPNISGDRDKLIQVIINLVSNAVKFTDKGSVTCRVTREKNEIVVSVSDTGIGIAPENYSAVFEQFKQVGTDTLTDKPKGTGLGLPICKEIVEHHGGRIWLESTIGKGSTFSFALPVEKSVSRPVHLDQLLNQLKEQVAFSRLNLKGKEASILVVDDDDSIRSLLHQELSDAGYLIDQATNGKEALARVRANRPDLIILDVMMPEMNGFDVAAVLKNDPQTMDIPIIVLSIVQDRARGFRIGVDRYLTKPIDTGVLFSEIGSLLEQGKSKKKVMIVDQDSGTVNTLTEVLKTKGYVVMESDGKELVENAIANQPDIIIINSVLSGKQDIVQTLRFEKGLENVLFLVYQ